MASAGSTPFAFFRLRRTGFEADDCSFLSLSDNYGVDMQDVMLLSVSKLLSKSRDSAKS